MKFKVGLPPPTSAAMQGEAIGEKAVRRNLFCGSRIGILKTGPYSRDDKEKRIHVRPSFPPNRVHSDSFRL